MTIETLELISKIGTFLFVLGIFCSLIPPKYIDKYPKIGWAVLVLCFLGAGTSVYINEYCLPKKPKRIKATHIYEYDDGTIDTIYWKLKP